MSEKVVVAMSGGVDSSVAAYLLKERGYDVTGLFMRGGIYTDRGGERSCCSRADAEDAKRVADKIGIRFYVLDFSAEIESLIQYFCDEYSRARTPNPCIVCNSKLKFGRLAEYADAIGARYLATGHYARVEGHGGRRLLKRGVDAEKDQSYVLFGLTQEQLSRAIFPLGELRKPQVRQIATELGLRVSDKLESQDICFVPEGDYRALLRERCRAAMKPGLIVDTSGRAVGRHRGLQLYTIGQRRGLGIALGEPRYVVRLDTERNEVVIGSREELLRRELVARGVNWIAFDELDGEIECEAQIRYRHKPGKATVIPEDEGVRVVFHEPEKGVAPGQGVVFYDGGAVLGGGWIKS